jgi:hypothetical protein
MGLCKTRSVAFLAVLALAALPAVAQDVIPRGSDAWKTAGGGQTYSKLSLPAGFLDANCDAVAQDVALEGVPVATSPEGAFGDADTIIERLSDAVFDEKGVATTKVVVRALHFRAADLVKSSCGDWSAEVGLAKDQASTVMTIVRESASGGTFTAPISVDAVWTFTRTSDGAVRQMSTSNLLTSDQPSPWHAGSCSKAITLTERSSAIVDSDNDARPDYKVAARATSFNPGYDPACRPTVLCRGKQMDPAVHCYGVADASSVSSAK